jgi:hypothetical protein
MYTEIGEFSVSPTGRSFSRNLRGVEFPHINQAASDHRRTYLSCGLLRQGLRSTLTTSCPSPQLLLTIYIGLAARPSRTTPWPCALLCQHSFPQLLHTVPKLDQDRPTLFTIYLFMVYIMTLAVAHGLKRHRMG